MNTKRLIFSIIAGFAITVVLSISVDMILHSTGIYPPAGQSMFDTNLVLLALSYRSLFTVFGAFITAYLARENAMQAVLILGIIGLISWVIGGVIMQGHAPAWFSITGGFTSIPLAIAGGKLYGLMGKQV